MTLSSIERGFRRLLLATDETLLPAVDVKRQQVYRRLVRNNLLGTLERACPHALRLAGQGPFLDVAGRFLQESPPTARLVRDVPGQFTAWLLEQPTTTLPHPAFAELCHFEALEIDVILSETGAPSTAGSSAGLVFDGDGDGDDDHGLRLDPSARLAVYRHPVHLVTRSTTTWPGSAPGLPPSSTPVVLLCFQRAEAFAVQTLSPAVGKVLVLASQGLPLGRCLASVVDEAVAAGVEMDVGRLRADLVDLQRRGAIARG